MDAWASAGSGGSFRAVAPAAESGIGLLLRGERVGSENVPNNAYAQDGQELVASAGACRAGSLVGARFRPLPAPPHACLHLLPAISLAFSASKFYLGRKILINNFTISEQFRNN